jgi:hypothetical protein
MLVFAFVIWATAALAFAWTPAVPALAVADPSPSSAPAATAGPAASATSWSYAAFRGDSAYAGGYSSAETGAAQDASVAAYDDPHGGYDSSTNKCDVCHAVHRAAGSYELLRADSQADSCVYCHVGGSAHARLQVYDLNPNGVDTANGHTIGASSLIPDSSTRQEATETEVVASDAGGRPVIRRIRVRQYDSSKNSLFRFGRLHSQDSVGSGSTGWIKIGPLSLTCVSCHAPHGSFDLVWRPRAFAPYGSADYRQAKDGAFRTAGYKLLKRYPSGSTAGAPDANGFYDLSQAVKVIEDTASAGANFSPLRSEAFRYLENGTTATAPVWISQGFRSRTPTGPYRDPSTVNEMALSWWCADCHNLDVGGAGSPAAPELGLDAHSERTHPAPFVGAFDGPGQCYSCHRNDLPPRMGSPDPITGRVAADSPVRGGDGCTQCHFGTADFYAALASSDGTHSATSDFPHSGRSTDVKLLGSWTVASQADWSTLVSATISEDHLDAVCMRCHPGVGVHE